MPIKQKSKRGGKKSAPAARRPRSRKQPRFVEPSPTLQQELLDLANSGARSFLWSVLTLAIIVVIAAAAFGLWSLRPVPDYASDGIEAGSPFDVTFHVENTSRWFSLSNLKITCVLMRAHAQEIPPTEASDVRFPAGHSSGLAPGESGTFTCPFRALLGTSGDNGLGLALRSEIYFHSEYDLPLFRSHRMTDDSGLYSLNTRLLPPRWTGK
jgi:hypothetical protein